MARKSAESKFRFKTTDSIGAAAAEDDNEFLNTCFVDTGVVSLLSDVTDRRLIVLGRTGAGKSAALKVLEDKRPGRVIRVSPEQLALNFVANSTILNFFASIGVNLDPFFKLLWRHVLTVEVLTSHFEQVQQAAESQSLLAKLRSLFGGATKHDKDMQQAIRYLETWGKSFWQDTEVRVKEITNKFEGELEAEAKATLGEKVAVLGAGAKSAERITEEEKNELITRGQNIITKAQVEDLHKVLRLVDAVVTDKQRPFFLILDGLDENWVEERLRYKLIMALMQTARDFTEVRHVKVIVALRRDLIERVFRLARDSGFQEEKYESLYLPLFWSKDQILEVLDKRIAHLVTRHYNASTQVTHADVLPSTIERIPIGQYIYSIAPRPRDVIALFNACIAAATDHNKLSAKVFKLAEGEYSRKRLRALGDEWSADHPALIDFTAVLQKRPASFKLGTISDSDIEEVCLRVCSDNPGATGLTQSALQVVEGPGTVKHFKLLLVRTFYQVGLVGLKVAATHKESWVDELGRSVSFPEINDNTSVVIHPAYRRALGVKD